MPPTALWLAAALLAAAARPAGCMRHTATVEATRTFTGLVPSMGVAPGGALRVSWDATATDARSTATGYLVLLTRKQRQRWYFPLGSSTSQEADPDVTELVCSGPSHARIEVVGGAAGNRTLLIDQTKQYSLALAVCNDGGPGDKLAVTIDASLSSGPGAHLPLEFAVLPELYLVVAAVYAVLAALWAWAVGRERGGALVRLVGAGLAGRAVETASQSAFFYVMRQRGEVPLALLVFRNLAVSVAWLFVLVVLLLVAIGWGVFPDGGRPLRFYHMLGGAVLLDLLVAAARAACPDADLVLEAPRGCDEWTIFEYGIHSLMLLGVIVALNFTIAHGRHSLLDSPWTRTLGVVYTQMRAYKTIRWAFLEYLLLPTGILILRIALRLSWQYEWMNRASFEVLVVVIFFRSALLFNPRNGRLLLRAFQDTGR